LPEEVDEAAERLVGVAAQPTLELVAEPILCPRRLSSGENADARTYPQTDRSRVKGGPLSARRASQNEDVDEQGEREKRDDEREGATQGGGRGPAAQGAAPKRADGGGPR
jgi:hypothetical protein